MDFIFSFNNTSFSNNSDLTINDLLESDSSCLHILIMNYDGIETEKKEYSSYTRTMTNNKITITCTFNAEDFSESNHLYATYAIIKENILIPISPKYENYVYKENEFKSMDNQQSLTNNDLKACAILDRWRNLDLTRVPNVLTDMHLKLAVSKNRRILMDDNENIILTKDNLSEEITFVIPRYYDGIDLETKNLGIYYIRPEESNSGEQEEEYVQGITEELHIEPDSTDEYIHASWTITDLVTGIPGTLTFAIIAEGDGIQDEYFWQTYPARIQIEEGIYKFLPQGETDFKFIDKATFRNDIIERVDALERYHAEGTIQWQSLADLIASLNSSESN